MVSVNLSSAAGSAVDQQRLVIAALLLPFFDGLGCHALDAELHTRHVVRRIHHEEQREGEQVHPDQDRYSVEDAANEVSDHECRYCTGKHWIAKRRGPAENASLNMAETLPSEIVI